MYFKEHCIKMEKIECSVRKKGLFYEKNNGNHIKSISSLRKKVKRRKEASREVL